MSLPDFDEIEDVSDAPPIPAPDKSSAAPAKVERLEWRLSEALLQYRSNVERALFSHLEELEKEESTQQLEVAKLRAENGMLRKSLNLTDPMTNMFQNVMFTDPKQNGKVRNKQGIIDDAHVAVTKSKQPKQPAGNGVSAVSFAGGKKRTGPPPAGGSWQQFVAWVPSGAALDAPEPWKPLPAGQATGFTGVVPVETDDSNEEKEEGSAVKKDKFKVLEIWHATRGELQTLRRISLTKIEEMKNGPKTANSVTALKAVEEDQAFETEVNNSKCIVHPHSRGRTAWDLCGLALVLYDMVMIPLNVFELGESFFLSFMAWVTRIFWTTDMGLSCITGVVLKDGSVCFRLKYILARYLKTWFLLDCFIVISDWLEVFVQNGGGARSLGRLSRGFRIARMARLLRLARMHEVINSKSLLSAFTSKMHSDLFSIATTIFRLCLTMFAMSHLTACLWWGIGDLDTGHRSWVDEGRYKNKEVASQYLSSLRWSLSQFSGGMEEIRPMNPLERLVAVMVWILSFMTAAIIWSVLTSNLTQQHIIGGSQSRQLATLRKYLKQNSISSNLALRMQRSAQHAISGDLTQDAIELLPVVSEPLRVEMHFEMYSPVMKNHPFFAEYIQDVPQVMRRVCHYGMHTFLWSNGDMIFSRGEAPSEPKMYFVLKGTLEYNSRGDLTTLEKNTWVAEPVLWTQWTYKGTLTAANDVKLAALHAKTFQEIVDRFKETVGMDPKVYAADYVHHLNQCERVTDLERLQP